jgi:hypothetical protein
METQKHYTFKDFLPTFVILTFCGWVGLIITVAVMLPKLGPRWLFFFFGVLALSGTTIPLTYFLNRRFPSNPPAEKFVIIRQAIWVGIFGALLAWLQMGRVLNTGLVIILATAFVMIEILLRLWEKSRWKPNSSHE